MLVVNVKESKMEDKRVRWIVYDKFNNFKYLADSKEDAMRMAQNILDDYSDDPDGIPDEVTEGGVVVAVVVTESSFRVTERKSDYDDPDEWPYGTQFDFVGDLYMREL